MKVRFYCNSEEIVDIENEMNVSDEEWVKMSEDEKFEIAQEWAANNGLEIGFEEIK